MNQLERCPLVFQSPDRVFETAGVPAGAESGSAEHSEGKEDRISSAVRLDLDDLGGEVCLVDFGPGPATVVPEAQKLQCVLLMQGRVTVTLAEETEKPLGENIFRRRLVPIEGFTHCRYCPSIYSQIL